MNPIIIARNAAILLFGVIVPLVILAQAYVGLASLSTNINNTKTSDDLVHTLSTVKKSLSNGNDYALFSLLYTENANQKTMINKQIMKVTIMQIGFAVSSVGMMLILLGFNDGGASGTAEVSGMKFDFKSGSTGVVAFLAGALMATAGGVLKNDYATVPIPEYVYVGSDEDHTKSINAFSQCKLLGEDKFKDCFIGFFQKINQGTLK
ncbi:conserved membrane hypothetical protein [Candidatus Nitrotoga sp. BS]|uniref:hypothetical protein n=1 Tax=Candidatus Nitrotoga sp. BS TaxID=2890408 RepID=UPI001EF1E902|nr:hypothetical protein [Candidatus Nitrotoga sp. BS]CAH1202628.1 conserved membrane hypothetical protein [Candidatus Nitrotoga sp. BS]